MANPWRSLLFRTFSRFPNQSSRISSFHRQVQHQNLQRSRLFSSLLSQNAFLYTDLELKSQNNIKRNFSSESAALEHKDQEHTLLVEIFSKSNDPNEIKAELESKNLSLNRDTVISVLRCLDGNPDVARTFFDWISGAESGKLTSKSCNLMLAILGRKEYSKEFWELVEVMKKKGYGVSKNTFIKVSESFSGEGLVSDSEMLMEIYSSSMPAEDSLERVCSRVCKIIREDEWGDGVKMKLEDMGVEFSGDLVTMVLDKLGVYPMKALKFFKWVKEQPSFKHDTRVYNAMAVALGREDCIEDFWGIANETRDAGCKMEMATYVKVSARFFKRKMMKDAVDLYEFMMSSGSDNPPVQDCLFLLRKIATGNNPDMTLFSRVLRVFTESGNVLTKSLYDGVLKSLTGAGKLGEREKILKAMEEYGLVANSAVHGEVILRFCKERKFDEACEYLDKLESSGDDSDSTIWATLIRGHCLAGEIDEASSWFKRMIERKGVLDVGYAFEVLMRGFCEKNRENDAFNFLVNMVNEKQLHPSYTTYKLLTKKLLAKGCLKEATNLLGLMRSHGFAPLIDPFIKYVAKSGSADDAMSVLKEVKVKQLPTISVFLRMFEAFFKAGRNDLAHDFLSKTPRGIRGHPDVLNLFYSKRPREATATAAAAAVS